MESNRQLPPPPAPERTPMPDHASMGWSDAADDEEPPAQCPPAEPRRETPRIDTRTYRGNAGW